MSEQDKDANEGEPQAYGLPCDCIDCGQRMETLEDWNEHEPCRAAYLDYVERWGELG
jgi:hypothetical protein